MSRGSVLLAFLSALSVGAEPPAADKSKTDSAKLQGMWLIVKSEVRGEVLPKGVGPDRVVVEGDQVTFRSGDKGESATFALDATKEPRWITLTSKKGGGVKSGIYSLQGDDWTICVLGSPEGRPKRFTTSPDGEGRGDLLVILKRQRP